MRLASIDIGSNTVRLLVADIVEGDIRPVRHERKVTRLAGGLHKSGRISERAINDTVEALKAFGRISRDEGAEKVVMAGTSALRDAGNAREVASAIEAASGLGLEIISGRKEAEIMSMGVMSGLKDTGSAIIFDIGGGSTELIAVDSGDLISSISLPVGVVRMMEENVHDDPPSLDDIRRLDIQAREFSCNARTGLGEHALRNNMKLIGTAGTATTLASIDMALERYDWQKVQGHVLHVDKLHEIETAIQAVPLDIRRNIRGMEPERADLIIAGARLTIRIMETLGFTQMIVSDHGLLEGLIIRLFTEA